MASTATILLADEDPITRAFLRDNLIADGYHVLVAEDRAKATALLSTAQPDIVVIDFNGETLALVDGVRREDGAAGGVDPDTPILVLSGRADELQRVRMLERGSDDIVAKPFSYPELRARIAALLRRARARSTPRLLRVGPLSIDVRAREVRVGGRRIDLPDKEYGLLLALAREPTRVFTKPELLGEVWGFRAPGRTRTLESHAARLRRRLSDAGARGLVRNVWGVGYCLI